MVLPHLPRLERKETGTRQGAIPLRDSGYFYYNTGILKMRIRKLYPHLFVDGKKHKLNDIVSVTKGRVYSLVSLHEPKAIEVTSRGFFGNKKTLLICSGQNEREELYQQIMEALK